MKKALFLVRLGLAQWISFGAKCPLHLPLRMQLHLTCPSSLILKASKWLLDHAIFLTLLVSSRSGQKYMKTDRAKCERVSQSNMRLWEDLILLSTSLSLKICALGLFNQITETLSSFFSFFVLSQLRGVVCSENLCSFVAFCYQILSCSRIVFLHKNKMNLKTLSQISMQMIWYAINATFTRSREFLFWECNLNLHAALGVTKDW